MAKLHSRGRRVWILAEREAGPCVYRLALLSDGSVLEKQRRRDETAFGRWYKADRPRWDVVRPLAEHRARLEREGWTLLPVTPD